MENSNHRSVALPVGPTTESPAEAGSVAPSTTTRTRATWQTILAALVVAVAVWLPRGLELNRFVTPDESIWLMRSANFYQALNVGKLDSTFQHGHPGVMVMYAGMAGYLWKFPEYVDQVDIQYHSGDLFVENLEALGQSPLNLLTAGRTFALLLNVIVLTLAFLYARRLIGLWPALISFLLIAFDPFYIGLTRILHPDSLLSTMMLLATLAFMTYLFAGRRTADLIAAGVYTALSWLTKTPAFFLIPLVGLLTLIEFVPHVAQHAGWQWRNFFTRTALWRLFRTWLIWGSAAMVVYVALWPAMWVAPLETLQNVLDISSSYAIYGHSSTLFFNGKIYNGDPGADFYWISYLWRTTPVVMLGMLCLAGAFFWRASLARHRVVLQTVVGLVASAVFFGIFMTLSAKKFDRYLLPAFLPLDFVAAVGWSALIAALATWRKIPWGRYAAIAVAVGVVGVQAGFAVNTYPYYLTFYNPFMGGASKAGDVMLIGWGEGLDEAGRYLNQAADPATTSVASWYERGPFSFFYGGESSSHRYLWESDYAAVYNHQWQREQPTRRTLAYFDSLTPVHTVNLNGIEYVKIYNLQDAPPSDYNVAWGDAINLMYYEKPAGDMYPGQLFKLYMYYVKSAPLEIDYKSKLRVVNQAGHTLLLNERKPLGMNTSEWKIGEILIDDSSQIVIPEDAPSGLYRIEISFYDPDTFDHLPAVQINNGQLLPDPYVLDYLVVGDWPPAPAIKVNPPVSLGGLVELKGAALVDAAGQEQALAGKSFAPGDAIDLRLSWYVQDFIHNDYTTFVHVIGPDGSVITQADQQPLHGFVPTAYWSPRQGMTDDYTIQLPPDAPNGEYRLLVGWYDLATLARLPMTQAGKPIGDAYQVATFTVR